MAYERVNWENLPSTNTPVNADNLNKMDAGIANIDVGGRNLLLGTKTFTGWNRSAFSIEKGDDNFYYVSRNVDNNWIDLFQNQKILYENVRNKTITISYEFKNSVATTFNAFPSFSLYEKNGGRTAYLDIPRTFPIATEWTKGSFSIYIQDSIFTGGTRTGKEVYFEPTFFLRTGSNNTTFQIRKIKLEIGNIATDWTPAPEDMYNSIYPVGSVYMSVNNVNPSTYFGGTWQQMGDSTNTLYKWKRTA